MIATKIDKNCIFKLKHMELEELKQLVAEIKQKESAQHTKEQSKIEEYNDLLIREWNPKISNWLSYLNYLCNNGYVFTSKSTQDNANIPFDQKCICTDSQYCEFGLVGDIGEKRYVYMGINHKDIYGEYDIRTDGQYWWIERNGMRLPMRIQDYEELLFGSVEMHDYDEDEYYYISKLESFEYKFDRLMEMIKNKAKESI